MAPRRPDRGRIAAALTLCVAAAACSDLTAPPPAPLEIAGEWFYATTDLAGRFFEEDVTCDFTLAMTLQGSGASFGGIYDNALLTCFLFGETQLVDGGGGDIVDGSRMGSAIQFDVDNANIRNTGTLSEDGMAGQVEILLVIQRDSVIDTVSISGAWAATR